MPQAIHVTVRYFVEKSATIYGQTVIRHSSHLR